MLTDGVLNNDTTTVRTKNGFDFVEEHLLKKLKYIVDTTDAKIVLSSDWRFDRLTSNPSDYTELKNALKKNGTPIYAHTGGYEIKRGCEIIRWLERWRGTPVNNFVILDDLPASEFDFIQLKNRFIHTNPQVGLTDEDAEKAIAIIKNADLFLKELSDCETERK